MGHRHKVKTHRTVGWSGCVGPRTCDGLAHGGVTHVDECACGATRRTESNGSHRASAGWYGGERKPAPASSYSVHDYHTGASVTGDPTPELVAASLAAPSGAVCARFDGDEWQLVRADEADEETCTVYCLVD